jgi:FkbM family methyltransferase
MKASPQRALAALLPRFLQHRIKKWYYPRLLRRFPESRWPGAAGARRLIRPGDHVVDAGANIGYVTMLLSRWVGPDGWVHSFEPVAETADLLTWNTKRLGLTNVRILPVALSDGPGEAVMDIPRYETGGENPYEARLRDPAAGPGPGRAVNVFRETLDAVLGRDLPRVTFVKMDVEGHEGAALRGATSLIETAHPAFLIEVSGDPEEEGSPARRLFEFLAARGYQACVDEDGRFRPRRRGERQVDYFFLRPEHLTGRT